ncbi:conserved hypothetical protein [Aspergillus fumigatus A1163]|uniref:Uncharacterized protein n=1 Tax=Aspergillus fumigatus (strain CBS 144.89 / FGSC A1163 / CEA10) TaxID=451804 RepID=B0Y2K6_ASPFC|nr:conserved hypothetical protein [Aspergillus fumigatus A1163]
MKTGNGGGADEELMEFVADISGDLNGPGAESRRSHPGETLDRIVAWGRTQANHFHLQRLTANLDMVEWGTRGCVYQGEIFAVAISDGDCLKRHYRMGQNRNIIVKKCI